MCGQLAALVIFEQVLQHHGDVPADHVVTRRDWKHALVHHVDLLHVTVKRYHQRCFIVEVIDDGFSQHENVSPGYLAAASFSQQSAKNKHKLYLWEAMRICNTGIDVLCMIVYLVVPMIFNWRPLLLFLRRPVSAQYGHFQV